VSGVWDPLRPELDTQPPRDPGQHVSAYVICSTARSGSGLLCRGLAATGLAGSPAEYFNPRNRAPLSSRWGAGSDLRAYVHELLRRRTSPAGVFGTKLHSNQLDDLRAETGWSAQPIELVEQLFPGTRYLRIVRDDFNRQAISVWIATHTGIWSERIGEPEAARRPVPYNFARIKAQRDLIARGELFWDSAFADAGIEPAVVHYDALVTAYASTIAAALEAATGARIEPDTIPPPDSRKQGGDPMSTELLERFRTDLERHPDGAPFRLDDVADLFRRGGRRARVSLASAFRAR
jgi:trehalose 2-sulfotransferase